MNQLKTFKTEIGGREVTVEVGKYAQLSNGSCIIKCGDTVVMTNVTMAAEPRPGMDFFPLGVDFEEKMYAVGKIPGGFKKREGRASDKAILTSRLIDRPIRPLFPKGLFNDVAVVATALSVDTNIPPEVWGMLGSSIALSISDIPFYASALHYSIDSLDDGEEKGQRHFPEITPIDYTNVCIDGVQTGIGGVTSWGNDAYALKKYKLPYTDYEFSFVLIPVK